MIGDDRPLRKILVASCLPFEGKSTVVFNLGLAFGEVGKRVIVADADYHALGLYESLGFRRRERVSSVCRRTA